MLVSGAEAQSGVLETVFVPRRTQMPCVRLQHSK
jgi:hypothetical protein